MGFRSTLVLATTACLLIQPAHADILRCGSNLIEQGDSAGRVIEKCGQPTSKDTITEPVWSQGVNGAQYQSGITSAQLWRYNFGSRRFPALVKIVDGIVQSITFEKSAG